MPMAPPVMPAAPTPWLPSMPVGPDAVQPVTGDARPGYSTAWQQWWRYNGDPYLNLRTLVAGMSTTTGGAGSGVGSGYRPSESQILETVVPALQASLEESSSTEIVRGAMIALARIGRGRDIKGLTLDHAARFYLGEEHQASIEASLVALGLRSGDEGADILLHLVQNTDEARELRNGEWVDSRTRVFATYGVALAASRSDDSELVAHIGQEVTRTFVTDETAAFEHHVALMLAMGLAPMTECDGSIAVDLSSLDGDDAHFCRGTQIVALVDYFEDTDRPFELRAHAAVPMARLSVGADPEYKERVAEILIDAISSRSKEAAAVRHSCVAALGVLGDGDDDKIDKDIRTALLASASRGEELQRRLSMVTLAKATARQGDGKNSGRGLARVQNQLEKQLATGRGDMSAWAALSLSLLGHGRNAEHAAVPSGLASALRDAVASRSDVRAAASALAVGVLRDYESYAQVLERLEDDQPDELRSYAALSLGMMGARESADALRAVLDEEELSPMLRGSVSIALRLLGDEEAVLDLLDAVEDAEEVEEQVALVSAAGVLGDAAAIAPLIALMNDTDAEPALRGSAALALGVLCDDDTRSWTTEISTDINYNLLTWTLQDPFGDGLGVLDMR